MIALAISIACLVLLLRRTKKPVARHLPYPEMPETLRVVLSMAREKHEFCIHFHSFVCYESTVAQELLYWNESRISRIEFLLAEPDPQLEIAMAAVGFVKLTGDIYLWKHDETP